MEQTIDQLLESLKTARTSADIARLTVTLLWACGIYNTQAVGYEISRLAVTSGREGNN